MDVYRAYRKYYELGAFRIGLRPLTGNPEVDLSDPAVRKNFLYFLSRRCRECEKYLSKYALLKGMDLKEVYELRRRVRKGKEKDEEARRFFSLLNALTSRSEKERERARQRLKAFMKSMRGKRGEV